MNGHFVVCGCGQLAWAVYPSSPADRVRSGHWDYDEWELEADAPPTLSLSEELDGSVGMTMQKEPSKVKLQVRPGRSAGAIVIVPAWEQTAEMLADLVTSEIQGPGVLVTPRTWTECSSGRAFLRPWNQRGWRWSSLEEVLASTFQADKRIVSGGRIWLRFTQGTETTVLPNGAEAAHAVAMAAQVLEQTLDSISPDLAREWREEEEPCTGWFTRQKIIRRVNEALRDGARSVELAAPALPLFAFSSESQAKKFEVLRGLHVKLELPQLSAAPWWEQITEAGFLREPEGRSLASLLNWGAGETVLLGEVGDGSVPEALESLHTYLRFNGQPFRLFDPSTLEKALEGSVDMDPFLTSVAQDPPNVALENSASVLEPGYNEDEWPSEALGATTPSVEETAGRGFSFDPNGFVIEEDHHPGFLRVFVDGERVAPENVVAARSRDNRTNYQISGFVVRRGSVVRVDFEPTE